MIFQKMTDSVHSIMEKIYAQTFIQELSQGVLPKEKFIFYLVQDAYYLADFSRALALTSSKLVHQHQARDFMQLALEAMQSERKFLLDYLNEHELGIPFHYEQSPACFMYTNYLLKTASTASLEEAVASLLPCFWVYNEVGKKLAVAQTNQPNPYQTWIDLYASEKFALSVQNAIVIANELGASASDFVRERMVTAFVRATQLEWLFWDSAYRKEQWEI